MLQVQWRNWHTINNDISGAWCYTAYISFILSFNDSDQGQYLSHLKQKIKQPKLSGNKVLYINLQGIGQIIITSKLIASLQNKQYCSGNYFYGGEWYFIGPCFFLVCVRLVLIGYIIAHVRLQSTFKLLTSMQPYNIVWLNCDSVHMLRSRNWNWPWHGPYIC